MTMAALFVLGAAVLATLALAAWAWIWFAIRHESSAMYSLGSFDGMHFENPDSVPNRFLPFANPERQP